MNKTGSFIAITAMLVLGSLIAIAPQTAPGRAVIQAVGVGTVVQPLPSPSVSPSASPVVGAAAVPVIDPSPDPIPVADPAPAYPVVQGAPCVPPGTVDAAGNCVVPDPAASAPAATSAAPVTPAPVNPAANQPGQGAPCLPPGVLTGNICAVPQPTPSPAS